MEHFRHGLYAAPFFSYDLDQVHIAPVDRSLQDLRVLRQLLRQPLHAVELVQQLPLCHTYNI